MNKDTLKLNINTQCENVRLFLNNYFVYDYVLCIKRVFVIKSVIIMYVASRVCINGVFISYDIFIRVLRVDVNGVGRTN